MTWGTVELEPEVRAWLEELSTPRFATAAFYIDLLAEEGPLLGEPYTRQLDGKLRELRFHLDRQAVRVTYWIASGRRIILLTVFAKSRIREAREMERAGRALTRCLTEEHTTEEEQCLIGRAGPRSGTAAWANPAPGRRTARRSSPSNWDGQFVVCVSNMDGVRRSWRPQPE